ncbi:helix-turn-helix domain-containing protein [Sphingomonas sp. SUN039]|uniref:helix-turn-helix domain-containing protein n=1 Tax=Sphingomonas sp. SUN039 TaxID=2937787 RepID=UPI002164EDB4|nr:helix-turn-helix domain-containing protein [Sphingomonas sp. SUN039]UVO54890.1 helix-turn-helix domain-containing protein [Sphingomonas sp. SUN039]
MLQSHNFAPPEDLLPYVRQFFVFHAALPDDFVLIDRLISESAMVRVLLKGDWSAKYGDEPEWRREGPSILFGPNSRSFGVRVRGPFTVVGVALRPSGWAALFDRKASDTADAMFALGDFWGDAAATLHDRIVAAVDDAGIVAAIESVVRTRLAHVGSYARDAAMAVFEEIARTDSTIRVADAAAKCGLSARALERRCCAAFGLTPKVILRRSRFLDMAAVVRGISHPDEEAQAALRFSDQSHLNREFRHFIGMTPGQFEKAQTPLLNAVLKLREDGLG